jgi:hypothetical protein
MSPWNPDNARIVTDSWPQLHPAKNHLHGNEPIAGTPLHPSVAAAMP